MRQFLTLVLVLAMTMSFATMTAMAEKGTPIEKNGTDVTFTKEVVTSGDLDIPYGENGLKFNFQLLNEDGTTWGNESAVVTTNSKNPTVTFKNVPNGTYTLTETAVEGWESSIPTEGVKVKVEDGEVTIEGVKEFTVTNTWKGTTPTPPGEDKPPVNPPV